MQSMNKMYKKSDINLITGVTVMKFQLICSFFLMLLIPARVMAVDAPTNVTLSATETTIKVDWNGDTEDDGYYIYWGTSSGNLDQRITLDDSATEHTITGLEPGTTYYIAVSAYENSTESDQSAVKSITTEDDTGIPETPTGLFVTGQNGIGQNFVTLKWDQNTESDLDYYNIHYGRTFGVFDIVVTATDADAASFTITGLTGSARYYFSITAIDTSGNESEKADSLIVDTLLDTRPPNPPAGISGALSSAETVKVSIQDGNSRMADFSGTILYYGNTSGNLDQSVDLGKDFSYLLEGLSVGSVWYFSAVSYDFSGNVSTATEEISVTIEETNRFLHQPDDFDGGCFISAAASKSRLPSVFLLGLLAVILALGIRTNRFKFWRRVLPALLLILVAAGVSNAETTDVPEMTGNNILGVSAGYFIPHESDFKDYYGEDTYPVYGFYERFLSRYFSVDLEAGFLKEKGYLLTASGEETQVKTKLTLVPVSASLNLNLKLMPYVVGYVGVGPDYWYCQEETDDKVQHPEIEEWVGGFHSKIGFRLYNTDEKYAGTGALVETSYSWIDRFGDNETDIGGWAFKFGLFYQF